MKLSLVFIAAVFVVFGNVIVAQGSLLYDVDEFARRGFDDDDGFEERDSVELHRRILGFKKSKSKADGIAGTRQCIADAVYVLDHTHGGVHMVEDCRRKGPKHKCVLDGANPICQ